MFCIKCGTQLMDGAAFCHKCGSASPDSAAVEPAAPAPTVDGQIPSPPSAVESAPLATLQQPVYEAIGSNARAGANVVSFPGLSGVLPIVDGLSSAPDEAQSVGIDASTVASLRARLQTAFDFLADRHGARGRLNRAMTVMKQAGQAISHWKNPTEALASAQPQTWLCTIELTSPEADLYNLCARQSELAGGYETRLLRTCRSCRQQRIVNPQFEKMQKERKQLQGWVMMQRNILLAMSRLRSDPDFVCGRCQGLDADERQIVLCPGCGTPHTRVLLGPCGKCGLDLAAPPTEPEVQLEAPPPPAAPLEPQFAPTEPPAPAAAPPPRSQPSATEAAAPAPSGKIVQGRCADCGNVIRIPLERIPPRGLKGKCSGCGRELTIRPPAPPADTD